MNRVFLVTITLLVFNLSNAQEQDNRFIGFFDLGVSQTVLDGYSPSDVSLTVALGVATKSNWTISMASVMASDYFLIQGSAIKNFFDNSGLFGFGTGLEIGSQVYGNAYYSPKVNLILNINNRFSLVGDISLPQSFKGEFQTDALNLGAKIRVSF